MSNERIVVRLQNDGEALPFDGISDDGVILYDETSAFPRAIGIRLTWPKRNTISRDAIWRVQSDLNWTHHEFHLRARRLADGALELRGVRSDALPPVVYAIRLDIEDLEIAARARRIRVPEGGSKEVVFEVADADTRRFHRTREYDAFDEEIGRFFATTGVAAGAVDIDGASLRDWTEKRQSRERRKACLFNVFAKLRSIERNGSSLIRRVRRIRLVDIDRIHALVDRGLVDDLRALSTGDGRFLGEGDVAASIHERLLDRADEDGGDRARYRLRDFRENNMPGMQCVVAIPMRPEWEAGDEATIADEDPDGVHYADIDIDRGVPTRDLIGFLVHMGELIDPRATDHFNLRDDLLGQEEVEPFVYYDLVAS